MSTESVRGRSAAVVILLVLLLAVLLGAVGVLVLSARALSRGAGGPCAPEVQCQQETHTARLKFGVALPTKPINVAEIVDFSKAVGEAPTIVATYESLREPFPVADLRAIGSQGATALVTWEPWDAGKGPDQPNFSLKRLASGAFDSDLRRWAAGLVAYRRPVLLRFAHEMNGNWYPWGFSVNGNEATDYVRAWRHVHDVVSGAGAKNVKWVWNPNVPSGGQVADMRQFYPGSTYVDMVGIDGYNWGSAARGQRWTSPEELFGGGIAELRAVAPGKPLLIGETACTEQGGSKAEWIRSLLAYLSSQADVSGFVWFNINKEADWAVDSSPESLDAFRRALAAR